MQRFKEIQLGVGTDTKSDYKVGTGNPLNGRLLSVPARPVEEPHVDFKIKGSAAHPMAVARHRGFLSRLIRIGRKTV